MIIVSSKLMRIGIRKVETSGKNWQQTQHLYNKKTTQML